MTESFRCRGVIGTSLISCMYFDDDYVPEEGSVMMIGLPPEVSPDRFGAWFASADGTYQWVKYPDPPFQVDYHEGKLKNADTMVEIAIETLPGNIAARLAALEALVLPPSP